eukprot:CAMPEP_0182437154 /NCGR_PEP_ID=MMETSP1167-20130531/84847_1 /TAXON_ID=2988 /ORGANISM="Mallomonas Sp, Strain CCMP3275" /LENGTH=120 /DNA_ID=CAMNT_0024629959 /DNA_START=294 /DNA_END=657 /DNA_ORIENTATION=-
MTSKQYRETVYLDLLTIDEELDYIISGVTYFMIKYNNATPLPSPWNCSKDRSDQYIDMLRDLIMKDIGIEPDGSPTPLFGFKDYDLDHREADCYGSYNVLEENSFNYYHDSIVLIIKNKM